MTVYINTYYQVRLERSLPDGGSTLITYIPCKFARKGETLKLKTTEGWEDGWVVKHVFSGTPEIPDVRKSIRAHRKRTGDSLPKIRP